ncbi:MAG: hypothetical protein OHK0017_09480 [Patescibacteria group bacterium]
MIPKTDELYLPKSWADLKSMQSYLKSSSNTAIFREDEDQEFYMLFFSLIDRSTTLQFIKERVPAGGIRLIKNDFPYTKLLRHLPYVKQCCLWSYQHLSNSQVQEYLQEELSGYDYFWYENELTNKSIPEIFHVQVFINVEAFV